MQTVIAGGHRVQAFIPPNLVGLEIPNLQSIASILSRADRALGRLDAVTGFLPDKNLFLYMYVRKEALLSSQIEGTQSTLTDVLRFEADENPDWAFDDVREVSNYVRALDHGLQRLPQLPISERLICELHSILLESGRGGNAAPGQFRRTQNWVGGGPQLWKPNLFPHRFRKCHGF